MKQTTKLVAKIKDDFKPQKKTCFAYEKKIQPAWESS